MHRGSRGCANGGRCPTPPQVYFDYMHSWIQMLQQLPQASHSLKNLLEEEWNFTKVITPYIRGGEAQSGRLFWSVGRARE